MRKFLIVVLVACGAPLTPEVPAGVPTLPAGQYYVTARVKTTTGACEWIGASTNGTQEFGGYVHVDAHGAFVSPDPELVKCATRYAPSFGVTCSGLGNSVTLGGRVWAQDGIIGGAGTGYANGDAGGCKRVEFEWWAFRYDRDGGK